MGNEGRGGSFDPMNDIQPSRPTASDIDRPAGDAAAAEARQRARRNPAWPKKIGHALVVTVLVAWIIFAALMLTLRYAILPNVDSYRGDIERATSRAIGERVHIGAIAASWRGIRPTLMLRDLNVEDKEGRIALRLPTVRATLSWDSLLIAQVHLAILEIDGPDLTVRRDAAGNIFVAGLPVKFGVPSENKLGEWVFAQNEIRVRGARVVWSDETRSAVGVDVRTAASAPGSDASAASAAPAAPPDLVLEHVDIALLRSGWRHRFALRASPPAALAAPLDVRAVIVHPLFARRLADPATWSGEIYANLAMHDANAWRAWIDLPDALLHGGGALRAWLRFASADTPPSAFETSPSHTMPAAIARLGEITVDVSLTDVVTRAPVDATTSTNVGAVLAFSAIEGRVVAAQSARMQSFAARHFTLRGSDGLNLAPTDLVAQRRIAEGSNAESGEVTVNALDLDTVARIAAVVPLPKAAAAPLASYRPRGVLDTVAHKWTGAITAPQTYRFDANFKALAIAAQPPSAEAIRIASIETIGPNGLPRRPHPAFGKPGFENLSGHVSANNDGGTIAFNGENAVLTMPGVFDEPTLHFAHLDGAANWRIVNTDIELRIVKLAFDNPDLAGNVSATYRHGPNSGSPRLGWLELDGRLTRADVARVPRYLPTLIGERTRIYLGKALVSGAVSDASFRLRGALERFNFRAQAKALADRGQAPTQRTPAIADSASTTRKTTAAQAEADEFHIAIKVHGMTFLYGPARSPDALPAGALTATATSNPQPPADGPISWPAFEELDGDVVFDHARMTIAARSAHVFGVKLSDVKADLPALADPEHVLHVTGSGAGPLQDVVRFVNASPIARWTHHLTETTHASGNTTFDLALDLPLSHLRDTKVDGNVRLANNDVVFNATLPPITHVNGRVGFSESGVTIAGLTGQALGGSLKVDATTHDDGTIVIAADGTLDAKALRTANVDAPAETVQPTVVAPTPVQRIAQRLDGSARYTVTLNLRSKRVDSAASAAATATSPKPEIVVESNLAGLAIDLPAPLAKPAAEQWPLRVEVTRHLSVSGTNPGATGNVVDGEEIRVALAGKINAVIERRRNAQGELAIARAAYGVNEPAVFNDSGSYANISLQTLDVDAWQAAIKEMEGVRPGAPVVESAVRPAVNAAASLLPDVFAIRAKEVKLGQRSFAGVVLAASHSAEGWQANVDADQVSGWVTWREVAAANVNPSNASTATQNRLTARLARLSIPQSEASAGHFDKLLDATQQKDIPGLDIIADNFELRGRKLGRLELLASNASAEGRREWRLEKLGLMMPEATLVAQGSWGRTGNAQRTRLALTLKASNVGRLMDRFGLKNTIKDGTAQLDGEVAWRGSPVALDFESMEGKIHLESDKGQFLKADPGIAKLLGVLSLQSLPRRFTLDFRDLFADGFAFDSIRADATIAKGIANTDDFKMRGVQATVLIAGSADLEHETQNLHVLVLPEINAGAAALGYAVLANPAIGLASFVAQYLLKDPISRALSFEYNVTGPWSKPIVSKIDRDGNATVIPPRDATSASAPASAPARFDATE